tara:strand:- start:31 stop:531 length:501 start_codon:yes stop_codon:yes gene_type:complete
MRIKDKPEFKTKPKPVTFSPDNTVREALDVMCDKNIGSVIITNADQTIAGIVTERDLMLRVLGPGKDPKATKISEIMTENIRAAKESDEMVDWMKVMSNERFRHLPVIDEEGKLVNMMSQGDFVAYTWPDLYDKLKQDVKGPLGRGLQFFLIVFAFVTLAMIILEL